MMLTEALLELGGKTRVIALQSAEFNVLSAPFDYEFKIRRGDRSFPAEGQCMQSAVQNYELLGLPFPIRVKRARRGQSLGRRAMGLLGYYDCYVPAKFRYAMDSESDSLCLPARVMGGYWCIDDFFIFERDEDAIACKMITSRVSIIDLHGSDEIMPEPPPVPLMDEEEATIEF